ncbi:MAG: glycosyltransferase [Spirochaetes bacterium]|nr:glycosyltransferase [Spirochaetota bacterium]
MSGITILAIHDRIACFHSLKPFLFAADQGRFTYTASPEWCLERDRNRVLVMVRRFIKPDAVDLGLMGRLREKYDRIAFFHDDAGGGIPRLEVLPFVDLFYSKALFRDRTLYGKTLYGKELYSDWYHRKYEVVDPGARERQVESRPEQLAKLRLSWNIGIGDYPRGKLRQRAGVVASIALGFRAAGPFYSGKRLPPDPVARNPGTLPVHARIALAGRPSIAHQRAMILERIRGVPEFLTGTVSQRRFNAEMTMSKIVLSPFGWGELCLRDFEAVISGALLLKPDMSHLETWPDIFIPGETYVPFDWDAAELVGRAEFYLANDGERKRIARAAWERYRSQLGDLSARFESTIDEISGGRA